jgi:4-hydroxybenzoate polyprenyltransferase
MHVPLMHSARNTIVLWGRLVKFSHSVFALPFALSMALILSGRYPFGIWQITWIVLAVVSARTAAMAFNRLVDAEIDARNPRTRTREIPSGVLPRRSVAILVVGSSALFICSAGALGLHCLVLSPLVLAVLLGYSLAKRFTRFAHLWLGFALACAPGGVWYALTGVFAWTPLWMMGGVLFWVAGFDLLYACQDAEFDQAAGLHSIPATLGVRNAFRLAACFHVLAVVLLSVFGREMGMGLWYGVGMMAFSVALLSQYLVVSPERLEHINAAFFTRNGAASLLYLAGVVAELLF